LLFVWLFLFIINLPVGSLVGKFHREGQFFPITTHFVCQLLLAFALIMAMKRNIFHYASTLVIKGHCWARTLRVTFFFYLFLNPVLFAISLLWIAILLLFRRFGFTISLQGQEFLQFLQLHPPRHLIILAAFSAVVLAPTIEELFFRGGIYRYLIGKISPNASALVTGSVFALLHWNLLAAIPLFFFSVFLTRFYEREQSLLVPIIVHGLFNGNSILFALMQSSAT
jgi:membrane protease YdiL (CAAX protease family)